MQGGCPDSMSNFFPACMNRMVYIRTYVYINARYESIPSNGVCKNSMVTEAMVDVAISAEWTRMVTDTNANAVSTT